MDIIKITTITLITNYEKEKKRKKKEEEKNHTTRIA